MLRAKLAALLLRLGHRLNAGASKQIAEVGDVSEGALPAAADPAPASPAMGGPPAEWLAAIRERAPEMYARYVAASSVTPETADDSPAALVAPVVDASSPFGGVNSLMTSSDAEAESRAAPRPVPVNPDHWLAQVRTFIWPAPARAKPLMQVDQQMASVSVDRDATAARPAAGASPPAETLNPAEARARPAELSSSEPQRELRLPPDATRDRDDSAKPENLPEASAERAAANDRTTATAQPLVAEPPALPTKHSGRWAPVHSRSNPAAVADLVEPSVVDASVVPSPAVPPSPVRQPIETFPPASDPASFGAAPPLVQQQGRVSPVPNVSQPWPRSDWGDEPELGPAQRAAGPVPGSELPVPASPSSGPRADPSVDSRTGPGSGHAHSESMHFDSASCWPALPDEAPSEHADAQQRWPSLDPIRALPSAVTSSAQDVARRQRLRLEQRGDRWNG